jgi:hypothetical protein
MSIERIMCSSDEDSLGIITPNIGGSNPGRSDAHEAIDDPTSDDHPMPSNIKYLLIAAKRICEKLPVAAGLIDRLQDSAKGCFFAPTLSNKRIKIVVRVPENMVALVWIVHPVRRRLTPSAAPAPARR